MDQGVSEPGVRVSKRPAKRSPKKNVKEVVNEDWTVADIVAQHPQATEVMAEYGLHC